MLGTPTRAGHHDLWGFPAIDDDIIRIGKFVRIAIGRRAGHSAKPHKSAGSHKDTAVPVVNLIRLAIGGESVDAIAS